MKITKKSQWSACVKFFKMIRFNAYIQFRTLYTYICDFFYENRLESKRIQVFPSKLQYQKVLSDLFKRKALKLMNFN